MMRKVGDWAGARNLTSGLARDIETSNTTVLRQIGLKAERLIVKWIAKQPSTWPALSPEYKKRKVSGKKKYSDKMLRRTGDMINRITSVANGSVAFAGVKKDARNKDGEKVASIAAVMEFGSTKRNIPARPFLAPVYRLMLKKIKRERLFEVALLKQLKKRGI